MKKNLPLLLAIMFCNCLASSWFNKCCQKPPPKTYYELNDLNTNDEEYTYNLIDNFKKDGVTILTEKDKREIRDYCARLAEEKTEEKAGNEIQNYYLTYLNDHFKHIWMPEEDLEELKMSTMPNKYQFESRKNFEVKLQKSGNGPVELKHFATDENLDDYKLDLEQQIGDKEYIFVVSPEHKLYIAPSGSGIEHENFLNGGPVLTAGLLWIIENLVIVQPLARHYRMHHQKDSLKYLIAYFVNHGYNIQELMQWKVAYRAKGFTSKEFINADIIPMQTIFSQAMKNDENKKVLFKKLTSKPNSFSKYLQKK